MEATPGRAGRHSDARCSGGFSLIEMLVAITISVVIGMGLYFVFNAQQRASRSQKTYNDMQTSCTSAMDTIKSDLLLAGYRAKDPLRPISAASAASVTFEFWDDNASTDPPYDDITQFTNNTQVTYSLAGGNLTKTINRFQVPSNAFAVPTSFVLAQNVDGLAFEYLKEDNAPWSVADGVERIRAVRVNLRCRAAREDSLYKDSSGNLVNAQYQYQRLALTAEVRPRNVAIAENPEDKTAPNPPAPVTKVWDEGQCGCLELKWPSNTDSDIAGYTVFYGTSAGNYSGRARATHQDASEQRYTLRNLTNTNTMYYIALAAYDKSGNQSGLSAAVAANPPVSVRNETDAGNDSTINPLPPPAPGTPSVATPADNQIQVSWTKTYSDCLTVPVSGYRVYRSANPNFTPEGASAGQGNCIGTPGPDETSLLDTGTDTPAGYLMGCAPYYYKIATVDCDPAQLNNYTDNNPATTTTYTDAQFASTTGTPTDGTRTSNPVLTSKAGYRRIILSLTNPSRAAGQSPDFLQTRIYFSTTAPGPQLSESRDADGYNLVTNGDLIPDGGGIVTDGGGPHTINFDDEQHETPPGGLSDPQLREDQTYYFLAVAYDLCKNHSQDTEESRSTAEQCRDCLTTETCRDAPPMPTNLRVTQGCEGAPLRLEWDYAAANYVTDYDFQGFRVVRCEGASCTPADPVHAGTGTVLGGTYLSPDTFLVDDTVVDGRIYKYRVYAGDCYYQQWLEGVLTPADIADNNPDNNASFADIYGISLGYFDRAHVVGGDSETRLTADIGASDTTLPVVSTSGWTHRQVLINSEIIECNGLTPTSFTDCTRGAEATIAIAHLAGTPVRSQPPALPRAAVTGDLSLVPPTFLHNTVTIGARNTSAGALTLNSVIASWQDPDAWIKSLIYDTTNTLFQDTGIPLTHGAGESTIALQPTQVAANAINVPLKLTFLRSDGTVDNSVDLREEPFDLTWGYVNNATGIDTCSRAWLPPAPAGIVAPIGPTIGGTTQNQPTPGTTAWPVPGATANPPNAVITPSGTWNLVTTNVHDTAGTGIVSVRLYYTSTDPTVTTPPAVTGDYPGCLPYTMVELTRAGGESWEGHILEDTNLALHDGRNVWYFIVAVDNEGNFDREPEAGMGAFQYYQQPQDPCLNTPAAPVLDPRVDASNVYLDWSASWVGTPPEYMNTNGSVATDLAGFRVFHRIGNRAFLEVSGSPFSPTTNNYTKTFTTATTSLSPVGVGALDGTLNVTSTAGFLAGGGKIKIGDEIITYGGITATSFTGCLRGQGGTFATPHPVGSGVTQDLLALETNSFYVRAFDSCSTGANFKDSLTYSEGRCFPGCYITIPTTIQPGENVTIDVQSCEKSGNGIQDIIYVQACSSVEGDNFQLVEDPGDTGWFSGTLATEIGTGAGGGDVKLIVSPTDTITIGGFASVNNSWGNVNVCSGPYICGAASTISVQTAPTDPCAAGYTPPNVSGTPVSSRVGTDTCTGTLKRQYLTWDAVAFPAGCTSTRYNVYYRYQDNNVWTPFAPANFASAAVCSATSCESTLDPTPTKINGNGVYEFQVTAVCTRNDCVDTTTGAVQTRDWESSSRSSTAADACP